MSTCATTLFWFRVRGPLGEVECRPARTPIVPIVDFFVRLRGRGRAASLSAARYCPEGTFDVAGVYEVTPAVDLIYGGEEFEIEAVTGTYVGQPSVLRSLQVEYLEQHVEDLRAAQGGGVSISALHEMWRAALSECGLELRIAATDRVGGGVELAMGDDG